MVFAEIKYKRISELPTSQKNILKKKVGDFFNKLLEVDSLVAISIANSVPHIESVKPINGTFSDEIITIAGGIQDNVFEY